MNGIIGMLGKIHQNSNKHYFENDNDKVSNELINHNNRVTGIYNDDLHNAGEMDVG